MRTSVDVHEYGGDNGDFINVGVFSLNGYERNALYENEGGGRRFRDVAYVTGCDDVRDGRGLGILDADLDGDLDLVMSNYLQPAALLINHSPSQRHWIRFTLEGRRSNRSAVGARVVIQHGATMQTREVATSAGYLSGQSLALHFGLGLDVGVDRVVVRWPSGQVQDLGALAGSRAYHLIEGVAVPDLVLRPELKTPRNP